MPDFGLSCSITRSSLSLADMDLNDHLNYYLAGDALAEVAQAWSRNQLRSPFVDGAVTTYRTREMINVPLVLEVLGDTLAGMKANMLAAIQAFSQDAFNIAWAAGGASYQFEAEASDHSQLYSVARLAAHQAQLRLTVPCQPVDLIAGF